MKSTEAPSTSEDIEPPPIPDPPQGPLDRGPRTGGKLLAVILIVASATVAAAWFIAARSESSAGSDRAPTSTPAADPAPQAPANLTARADRFKVVLTWRPGGGAEPLGYSLYRDGRPVGASLGTATRFVDKDVIPGTRYRYVVKAYGGEFGAESDGSATTVRTMPAPPALARLAGVFSVRLRVSSSYGITEVHGYTAAWRMKPDCPDGPCAVHMGDLNGPIPNLELARRSGTYDGEISGDAGYACGGVPMGATYDLHLRVTDAADEKGAWGVTKLEGTLSLSLPESLGCQAGGATYELSGSLTR